MQNDDYLEEFSDEEYGVELAMALSVSMEQQNGQAMPSAAAGDLIRNSFSLLIRIKRIAHKTVAKCFCEIILDKITQ